MELLWYGQAFFRLKGKSAQVLIDPFYAEFTGLELPKDTSADVVLQSHTHQDHSNLDLAPPEALRITGPGEYEVKGVSIIGVATHHDKQQGAERGSNTIFNVLIDNLNVVHLGDLGHTLSEDQIQNLGNVDILLVPVGGTYTINAKEAAEVVAQLEPSIIIPMHFKLPDLKFDLSPVEDFLKEMGAENIEPQSKLTITKEKLPEETEVVLLQKS